MNNTGTCPDIDSDFLKYPNWPRAENSFGSWHCLQSCMAMGMVTVHGWWNLEDFIKNWHRANLGSPSFTTHSLYLSCTSHSSRNLQSSWARGMTHRWKSKLAKRTKNEQSLLKITKMDAISVGEALLVPSGDYVLLAPSGDYNQSIPPKSTNRIRCFTSRTVLLPTSAKLTRGIWEINRGEIFFFFFSAGQRFPPHRCTSGGV